MNLRLPKCDLCGEPWEDGGEGEDWNDETGCHVSCEQEKIVCRDCGSDDLASVEARVAWQRVGYVKGVTGIETREPWGDDVGDDTSETIGVACVGCSTETRYDDALPPAAERAFCTLREFEAAHPMRRWRVVRERIVGPPPGFDGKFEVDEVVVEARTDREAVMTVHEHGMVDGRYPWRGRSALPA